MEFSPYFKLYGLIKVSQATGIILFMFTSDAEQSGEIA
jgi:hypothetical protein